MTEIQARKKFNANQAAPAASHGVGTRCGKRTGFGVERQPDGALELVHYGPGYVSLGLPFGESRQIIERKDGVFAPVDVHGKVEIRAELKKDGEVIAYPTRISLATFNSARIKLAAP